MTTQMIVGLSIMAAGVLFVVLAAISRGQAYEYLWGVFFGEWGAMHVVSSLVAPGTPRLGVTLFFGVAMLSTAWMWWRLRPRDRSTPSSERRTA